VINMSVINCVLRNVSQSISIGSAVTNLTKLRVYSGPGYEFSRGFRTAPSRPSMRVLSRCGL